MLIEVLILIEVATITVLLEQLAKVVVEMVEKEPCYTTNFLLICTLIQMVLVAFFEIDMLLVIFK